MDRCHDPEELNRLLRSGPTPSPAGASAGYVMSGAMGGNRA